MWVHLIIVLINGCDHIDCQPGYQSLVGTTADSWGWDLGRGKVWKYYSQLWKLYSIIKIILNHNGIILIIIPGLPWQRQTGWQPLSRLLPFYGILWWQCWPGAEWCWWRWWGGGRGEYWWIYWCLLSRCQTLSLCSLIWTLALSPSWWTTGEFFLKILSSRIRKNQYLWGILPLALQLI